LCANANSPSPEIADEIAPLIHPGVLTCVRKDKTKDKTYRTSTPHRGSEKKPREKTKKAAEDRGASLTESYREETGINESIDQNPRLSISEKKSRRQINRRKYLRQVSD
jgi:hypothetical protein